MSWAKAKSRFEEIHAFKDKLNSLQVSDDIREKLKKALISY